ncbi:MFS transporter [Lactobacillaceae bacterium Melli_B4]
MNISNRESNYQIAKSVVSNFIGGLSSGMLTYGIGLMLLNQTNLAISFGLSMIISPIMGLILMVPIGNVVDTYDHKKILLFSICSRIMLLIILRLMIDHFAGIHKLILIIPFLALTTGFANLSSTTYFASIHELVNEQRVNSYNSLTASASAIANILAPALGVSVYYWFGFDMFIMLEIVGATVSLLIILLMKFYPVAQSGDSNIAANVKTKFIDGLRYVKNSQFIMSTILMAVFINFLFSSVNIGLPYLIKNALTDQMKLIDVVEPFFAIGMLAGSLFMNFWPFQNWFRVKIITCFLVISGCSILIGGTFAHDAGFIINWIIISALLLIGFFISMLNVSTDVKLQESVPNQMLGRIMSLLTTACSIVIPLGKFFYSFLFDHFQRGFIIFIANGIISIIYTLVLIPKIKTIDS